MKPNLEPIDNKKIPNYVTHVTKRLEEGGFEAFLVGGCVRDLLMKRNPKDWDITTNATPEEIQTLFDKTVYENSFGTVAICIPKTAETGTNVSRVTEEIDINTENILKSGVTRETYWIVEVTPYRIESDYKDSRHPNSVSFSKNIEDDLKRRDFTINALAYSPIKGHLIDLYKGQEDIKDRIIRTVGNPTDRFTEDALRLLRAIRFSTVLDFTIESETGNAIFNLATHLQVISQERIRDEFTKIIESQDPMIGIGLLERYNLLKYVIPELREGIGCEQKGEHIYDVFEHSLHALQHAAEKNSPFEIRLSALFHDIGKPRTRRWDGTKAGGKGKYTFYGHEVIGAKMTKKILERLHFPKKTVDFVTSMVRYHMFFSDTEKITLSAVRRIIQNVGKEHIWDLMQVRECDRAGMKKTEAPYRLRKYHAMIEEALRDPISVSQLAIDGTYLMNELHMKPGPRMGWILHALLEEVLEDPTKNTVEHLSERVKDLQELEDIDLKKLGEKGKGAKEDANYEEIGELRKKHNVR